MSCALTGESTDADPGGLAVHAGPRPDSRVLGRLYPGMDPETFFHDEDPSLAEGLVGAQFTVDRIEGDWLHIADIDPATDAIDPQGNARPKPNFQGSGWVPASKVRLLFVTVAAHEAPDARSPLVEEARFFNGYEARFLRECRGPWARLEDRREGDSGGPPVTGWLLSESNRQRAEALRNASAGGETAR